MDSKNFNDLEFKNVISHLGVYDYDIYSIKKYGSNIRIVYLPRKKVAGLEGVEFSSKGSVNDSKLSNNIVRARSRISELLMCNDFKYFVTLTISPEKYDRYNLKLFYKDFSKFIQNYNRYCTDDEKVQYVLVPEMHKDGAWHFHGVLNGIKDKDIIVNKNNYLEWISYSKKFGYISMGLIKDKNRLSNYIRKYINKNMDNSIKELGMHSFYASKGLKSATLLYEGHGELINGYWWDFEHPDGYCKILNVDTNLVNLDEVFQAHEN